MYFPPLITFERYQGPPPLFKYAERFILRHIDDFSIDENVQIFAKSAFFCYEILQRIKDFYIEDWELAGVLLNDDDYEIFAVVLDRKSSIQASHYRIAITARPPYRLIEAGSRGKGRLFQHLKISEYEYRTLERKYARKLRDDDKNFHPSHVVNLHRVTDELNEVSYYINNGNVFFKAMGPSGLFAYAERALMSLPNGHGRLPPAVIDVFRRNYPDEYNDARPDPDLTHWRVESASLDEKGAIQWLLMFYEGEFDRHLVLDGSFSPLEMFHEKITYEINHDADRRQAVAAVAALYERRLSEFPPIPEPTKKEVEPAQVSQQPDKGDGYDSFRAYFSNRKIVVIGPSFLSPQEMETLAYELGLPHGTIDYAHRDYDKLRGTSFDYLKNGRDKYLGVIVGPTPHKVGSLGLYRSLSSKLKQEPGFPYTVEASSTTLGKNLKLTKRSFQTSLFQIMRYHLAFIDQNRVA